MAQVPKNTQGLPPNFKVYSPFPFAGMDLKASPLAMADQKFYYLENFLKIGDGYLRTAWDVSVFWEPGKTIVSHAFYVIGSNYYAAVFFSDGSATQINVQTSAQAVIGPAGTFYDPSTKLLPATAPWAPQYLLISNRNTPNDFWAWDGTLLYKAGTAAPNGAIITNVGFNYSSAPTVTAYGGEGSGLVVVPTVSDGEIVQLQITNPGSGYEIGDVVQLAFSGGGSDNSAILEAYLNPGSVGAVTVSAGGTGYTGSATVSFSGGGGSGAAGTPIVASGVASVAVTAGGTNYTYANIAFSGGGGSGAVASADISGGVITDIVITNPGSGYTSAPTATLTGTGTGATLGTVTIQGGVITGVTMTSGGTGYTSTPSVSFGGSGSGATGVALLAPSGVAGVNVINGGSGFTSAPNVSFVGGGGAGAIGYVELVGTSIAKINLTAGGSDYNTTPVVTFVGGGGGGASAYCVMEGASVGAIVLTAGGAGYTGNVEVLIQLSSEDLAFNNELIATNNKYGLQPFTGSGAGGTAVYVPTSIAGVVVSNAGISYTNPPSVQLTGGANNAASAVISLMPYGVSGSCMETFNSRLWIANPKPQAYATLPPGGTFQWSAPGSFTDFATSAGGGVFVNSDRFLQQQYTGIRQSNGYLYFFGDSSVSVVSNVQTTGNPSVTTFTYQNVDPQIGMSWRDTLQDFGRSEVFGNTTGVFGLYGGNVTKISSDLDRLFSNAVFPPTIGAVTPSGACATLFDVKHYLMLMTITDPDTGAHRNVMVTWNEKDWVVTSQSTTLIYISTQEVSSKLYAWGTDGTSLYQLFAQPSASLTKRLDTKFYGADSQPLLKDLYSIQIVAQDQSVGLSGVSGTVTAVVSAPALPPSLTTRQESFQPPASSVYSGAEVTIGSLSFQAPAPYWPIWTSGTPGIAFNTIGLRFSTTSPDVVIGNLIIGYVPSSFAT